MRGDKRVEIFQKYGTDVWRNDIESTSSFYERLQRYIPANGSSRYNHRCDNMTEAVHRTTNIKVAQDTVLEYQAILKDDVTSRISTCETDSASNKYMHTWDNDWNLRDCELPLFPIMVNRIKRIDAYYLLLCCLFTAAVLLGKTLERREINPRSIYIIVIRI